MSNWDVHVFRTRDGKWAARISGWRSNEYELLSQLMSAVGNKIAGDVFEAAPIKPKAAKFHPAFARAHKSHKARREETDAE